LLEFESQYHIPEGHTKDYHILITFCVSSAITSAPSFSVRKYLCRFEHRKMSDQAYDDMSMEERAEHDKQAKQKEDDEQASKCR